MSALIVFAIVALIFHLFPNVKEYANTFFGFIANIDTWGVAILTTLTLLALF